MDYMHKILQYFIPTAVVACGIVFYKHFKLSYQWSGEAPVHWSFLPILGHALEFGNRPVELALELSKISKDVVGGERMFFVNSPFSFKVILKPIKQLSFDVFTHKVAINVLNMTPDLERTAHMDFQKYLLQDKECGIITRRMQEYLYSMLLLQNTNSTQTVNLVDFVYRTVFKASMAGLFNVPLASEDILFDHFIEFDKVFALLFAGVPIWALKAALKGRDFVLNKVTDLSYRFSKATASGAEIDTDPMLRVSNLMKARYDLFSAHNMGPRDIGGGQLGVLWASAGNTMVAAFWMIHYLLLNKDAYDAAMGEITSIFQLKKQQRSSEGLPSEFDGIITDTELNSMIILNSCFCESMRLQSGSMMMREATEDVYLEFDSGVTYKFRKGDKIGIFPPLVHFDADIYPDPYTFKYDRFINAPSTVMKDGRSLPASNVFLPFGGGMNYCPGRKFANYEIKSIVAVLLYNYDIKFVNKELARSQGMKSDGSRAGIGIFPPVLTPHAHDVVITKKNI